MSSHMLQVPSSGAISLPPSQTPTIVNVPIADTHSGAEEVQSIHNSLLPSEMDQPLAADNHDDNHDDTQVPQVSLTFLVSSGKRKTFHFEQDSPVAAVKDRLMREWPTEWENETRPQAASQIRLLHMGRLLSDEETLSAKSHFPPRPAPPTIVHVSIRPFPVRAPSGTGSLKQRASILRASSFARGNTTNQRSGDATQLDSVREQADSNSGCTCCVIC